MKTLHARLKDLESENQALKASLKEAVSIIDGLAGQQAMQDDWYIEDRDRIAKSIEEP